jgi:nicotinate phosphoribosyltransferase
MTAENTHVTLLTDFYQLSMAYAYWKSGLAQREACFHLFYRRAPFKGGFTVACGLEPVIKFIKEFRYDEQDLAYLASIKNRAGDPYFDSDFLQMLGSLRLSVHIDAVSEGRVMFPHEPLMRVEGPLLQCQLLESALLNLTNFPTLIATKAARICEAAQNDPVMEFGLRRAQGIDGALTASRAAFVGGCSSTSNVLAGQMFGIPVQGTHAHSWVMAFEDEEEAFKTYAEILPESSIFLVDTYDTIEGVKKAIRVGKQMQSRGKKMVGIRLDSGDLAQLSIQSRELLDKAGFHDAVIVASNELDEFVISELKHQGAKISVWGVGTNLVTGKEHSSLDGVYKLSALKNQEGKWQYTLKLSEQPAKVSNPGRLQVKRFMHHGRYVADILYDIELGLSKPANNVDPFDPTKHVSIDERYESFDLLEPIFREGRCVYTSPPLDEIRKAAKTELDKLPVGVKRFLNPHVYPVGMEKSLYDQKIKLIKKIRKHGRIS